jgi:ParB-like chromosome segregation protein Spo0J
MVLRYAAMLREMKKAPPIVLARQDNKLHQFRVIDGQHRYHAAKEVRRLKIKAIIAE